MLKKINNIYMCMDKDGNIKFKPRVYSLVENYELVVAPDHANYDDFKLFFLMMEELEESCDFNNKFGFKEQRECE